MELCTLNRVLTFKLSLQRFVKHLRASSNNLAPARLKTEWRAAHRNVAAGDVVWLADQHTLRGQYRLARVVNINADKERIVRDVHVKTFPSYPVWVVKPSQEGKSPQPRYRQQSFTGTSGGLLSYFQFKSSKMGS